MEQNPLAWKILCLLFNAPLIERAISRFFISP